MLPLVVVDVPPETDSNAGCNSAPETSLLGRSNVALHPLRCIAFLVALRSIKWMSNTLTASCVGQPILKGGVTSPKQSPTKGSCLPGSTQQATELSTRFWGPGIIAFSLAMSRVCNETCLSVCVFSVCVCAVVCVCLCLCVGVFVFVCLCACVFVWFCACVLVCLCACALAWLCGCVCVCVFVWLCVYLSLSVRLSPSLSLSLSVCLCSASVSVSMSRGHGFLSKNLDNACLKSL